MAGIHFNIKQVKEVDVQLSRASVQYVMSNNHFATEEDVNKYEDGLMCPIKPTLESVQNEDINIS